MAQNNIATYSMPLEVYLQSAVLRGMLVTNQDRLSNHLILREGEEIFSLREVQLTDLHGKAMGVNADEYLVYMHQVFAIADLSPQFRADRSGLEHLYVRKDQSRALLGVGPFWVRGNIHLTPGALIHDLLLARTMFIPVTNATMLHGSESEPRTYLVNRTQVGCLTGLSED
ncbi:MAG TPA: hypothetical protein VIH18_13165 [Candidatus Binatia bacterium]